MQIRAFERYILLRFSILNTLNEQSSKILYFLVGMIARWELQYMYKTETTTQNV